MEEMIAKWIRDVLWELERAKRNQNYFRAVQMQTLKEELIKRRDRLAISYT
jgi:hypothetical protein